MRRDWEEVTVYSEKKTVWNAYIEDVPCGDLDPQTGHNIFVKIIRKGKVLCNNYGALQGPNGWLDNLIVKKIIRRPEEVLICV